MLHFIMKLFILSIYLSIYLSVTVPFFWHNTFVTVIYHQHFLFLHFCMANTLFILVQLNVILIFSFKT